MNDVDNELVKAECSKLYTLFKGLMKFEATGPYKSYDGWERIIRTIKAGLYVLIVDVVKYLT